MEMGNIAQEIIKKSEVHYKTEYNDYKTILDEMDKGKFDTIYEVARFAYEHGVKVGLKAGIAGAVDVVKEKIRG